MPFPISMVIVGTPARVAVANRVPAFDIARSCKLDAAAASLSVDQTLKNCVIDENKGPPTTLEPMSQVLGLQQSAMHSARECWRYTKLCEPFDLPPYEFMGPMTVRCSRSVILVRDRRGSDTNSERLDLVSRKILRQNGASATNTSQLLNCDRHLLRRQRDFRDRAARVIVPQFNRASMFFDYCRTNG